MQYFNKALQFRTNHNKVLRQMMIPAVTKILHSGFTCSEAVNIIWSGKEHKDIREYANEKCEGYKSITGILVTWSPFVDTNIRESEFFSFSSIVELVRNQLSSTHYNGLGVLLRTNITYRCKLYIMADIVRACGYDFMADELLSIGKGTVRIAY